MDRRSTASLRPLPSPAAGLPRLRDPLSRRAVPLTPVDRSRCICRLLPCPCCLLRTLGGSASTTSLSRPAQALHTLRPVDSLPRPGRGLSQGFDTAGYPAAPPASYRANRPLPGWDLHPRGVRALRGRTRVSRRRKNSPTTCSCSHWPGYRWRKGHIQGMGCGSTPRDSVRTPCNSVSA
jgi:hypothetical protein